MKDLEIKKLYYSISEVSRLIGEEHYVLRYWETEFDRLKPQKNRAGNRVYTQKDIAILKAIKQLLRDKRYTIEGAKDRMKDFDPETGQFAGMTEELSVSLDLPKEQNLFQGMTISLQREELVAMRGLLREILALVQK